MNFFKRLYRIAAIIYRYGLLDLAAGLSLPSPLSWLIRVLPAAGNRQNYSLPVRLRQSLEELGPIYVKFGQILSTRPDIFPAEYITELARLQDRVAPFANDTAFAVITAGLKKPLDELFYEFNPEPVASASIAQVYQAYLRTNSGTKGQKVAVKVLRPNIKKIIKQDLNVLKKICRGLEWLSRDAQRLKLTGVLHEFEKYLHDEVNLLNEAANGSLLRRQFTDSPMLIVPEIYFAYSTKDILTSEWMDGTAVTDIAALKAKQIDLKRLADFGVNIFFTQVFQNGFFHADMHPGNILVADDGRYIALDFGIVGSLTEFDKRYLALNFLAFFERDYYRVAAIHLESGWIPADTRIEEFEAAIRYVCEPMFNQPLVKISFGMVLLRLFEVSRRFNIEIQPQLVLLQKTLLNVEGLGRQLNPDLDLWVIGKPFFANWKKEQFGFKSLLANMRQESLNWSRILPRLPVKLYDYLEYDAAKAQQFKTILATQKRNNLWLKIIFALLLLLLLYLFCGR